MNSKIRGKLGDVALNYDISKTCDILCVETIDYFIIINQDVVGPIIPTRGIKQGDSFSLYLFITCVEGLSTLITHAERRGARHDTKICINAPKLSILSAIEAVSGQIINLQKSEILCSCNVPIATKVLIASTLGVQAMLETCKYLGLTYFIGCGKKNNI